MRHPLPLQISVDLPTLIKAASTDKPSEAATNQYLEIYSVRSVDIKEHESLHNKPSLRMTGSTAYSRRQTLHSITVS